MEQPTPTKLVMRSEIGAESPFWHEGMMVDLDDLPLSSDLVAALTLWAEVAWEDEDPVLDAEGRRLHEEVVRQLGPGYDVRLEL